MEFNSYFLAEMRAYYTQGYEIRTYLCGMMCTSRPFADMEK